MAHLYFKVGSVYCYDCVIALKKFIGSLDGVSEIETDGTDKVKITYDPSLMDEEKLRRIVTDSIEKLGFKFLGWE